MSDNKNTNTTKSPASDPRNNQNRRGRGQGQRRNKDNSSKVDSDIDKKIISIRRVTRVYKGGKRMRLSVAVAVGDRKGKVGIGMGKGPDVKSAEEKAVKQARKNMVEVTIKGSTIPHQIFHKKGAARIVLRPASPGTGIIAGGAVRAVVELAGVRDVLSKIIGTSNKITNAQATLEALGLMLTRSN